MFENIKATDVKDVNCIKRKKQEPVRGIVSAFACVINGNNCKLFHTAYRDGGYFISSSPKGIWEEMSPKELDKLNERLIKESNLTYWIGRIMETDTHLGLEALAHDFMCNDEVAPVNEEQAMRFWTLFRDKENEITLLPEELNSIISSLHSDIGPFSDYYIPWGVESNIEDALKALEELRAYKSMVKSPQELRGILVQLEQHRAAEAEEEREDY